jgi:hypothetical protein
MFTGNLPIDTVVRVSNRRHGVRRGLAYLLLVALVVITAACRSQPTPTAQWLPPYLQLRLQAGKAQVQWTGASDWMTLEGKASILIEETVRIVADAIEGAQFSLGDGSGLELGPEAVLEVQNPRTLPRLQVILEEGSLLFDARDPSYDLITPVGSVTLLSIPSRVSIEVSDDTTHVVVEEGAVSCVLENETVTLLASQEMVASFGEELEVTEFYDVSATATASALALSAGPTPSEAETTPTPTPTMTPTPSPTPTATPRVVWTPTSTPPPPTDTPKPSSSHKPPPPTQPPPTQPPPTQPPEQPTEESPPESPTEEPPPESPTEEPPPASPPEEPPTEPPPTE